LKQMLAMRVEDQWQEGYLVGVELR
jgi:hypothetical protein